MVHFTNRGTDFWATLYKIKYEHENFKDKEPIHPREHKVKKVVGVLLCFC
jgi:hypothetical protein